MIRSHRINFLICYQKYINIVSNKNIHLSHFNGVRKPSSARRVSNSSYEDFQVHNVAGIFPDPPKSVNVFENFYGIESDEGVIHVEECEKAEKSLRGLKKMTFTPMYEYRSYNFGAVRLDNENKPSYAPRRRAKRNENDKEELNAQDKNTEQSDNHSTVRNRENELNYSHWSNINQNNIPKNLFNYDKPEQVTSVCDVRNQIISTNISSSLTETSINNIRNGTTDNFTSSNLSDDCHVTDFNKQKQLANQDSESLIEKDYFNEYYKGNFVHHIENSSDDLDKIRQNTPKNFFSYDNPEQIVYESNRGQQNVSSVVKPESDSLSVESDATDFYNQNQFFNQDFPKVSESFIDKDYFDKYYTESPISQTEKSSSNFIEELFFNKSSLNASESDSKLASINHTREYLPPDSLTENFVPFTKKSKPGEKREPNSVKRVFKSKQDEINSYHNEIDIEKDSKIDSESLIDKDYFDKYYTESPIPQTEESSNNFIDEQFFNKSSLNVSESDSKIASINHTREYLPTDSLTENFVPFTKKLKPGEKQEPNSEKRVFKSQQDEINSYHNKIDIEFNQNISPPDLTKASDVLSSKKSSTVSHEKNKLKKEDLPKKADKKKSLGEIIKTDFIKESEKNSQTEHPYKNISSEKTLNSSNKLHEKRSSDESEIGTAFDFVKKLRGKNKLLSDEVKKGISAKKERKVDSKGFRILKHQVPSLEYFTRDEMLELLKRSVLYTDEDVVVLNKPYNLVMHESSTSQDLACLSKYLDDLAKLLDKQTNSPKLFTVHRLDKETTGCLLLARNEVSAARLKSLFAQREIAKTYWIVTTRVPDPMEGIIDIPISEGTVEKRSRMVLHPKLDKDIPYVSHSKAGKQAITQYSVIAVSGNAALVEVKPETGIKHQIRVHFGFGLGCPILGDHKYSHLDKLVPQKLPSDLLQRLQVRQSKVRHIPLHIHSKHVLIPQYSNGRNLFVTAPLPNHMSENLRFLKFKKK